MSITIQKIGSNQINIYVPFNGEKFDYFISFFFFFCLTLEDKIEILHLLSTILCHYTEYFSKRKRNKW